MKTTPDKPGLRPSVPAMVKRAALLLLVAAGSETTAAPPAQHEPPASLAAEGWYAGDLHIHRPPQEIESLAKQADLHIAPVITWWNETNPWKNLPPPKSPVAFDGGGRFYHLLSGEDERGGGALLFHNLAQPLEITGSQREWPSSVKFLRAAKAAGAWCEVEKPFWLDVPLWLASGIVDSIGICNNHIQIGGMMDNEAWGRPRDRDKYPGPHGNGLYSQDLYYRILNCGFRLPPTAGGASGVLQNPVGYNRVYVQCEAPLSWEKWWSGLKAGRAFVSNGPLLRVKADGHWPGHAFKSATPLTLTLDGKIEGRDPVKSVELIVNGVPAPVSLPHRFEMKESGWFLVRAISDVPRTFRFASTAPWYVEIGEKPAPPRRADAQFFLDWTKDRAAAVDKAITDDAKRAEVHAEWMKAEAFWQTRAGPP
jgi:hypothetical protein